jgi:cell division inhibitor SepF
MMYQDQPYSTDQSGNSSRTNKPEVDLFPPLADRKTLSVVAPRPACNGPAISMFEPTSYEDALDIVECLRSRSSTTVCLDKMRKAEADRLVDFISGASAAIDGRFHQLSDQVYFFAPSNVRIVVTEKAEETPEAVFMAKPSYPTPSPYAPTTTSPYATEHSSYTTQTSYTSQPSKGVPPLNSRPLDQLYPDTGNQSGSENIWTRHPN